MLMVLILVNDNNPALTNKLVITESATHKAFHQHHSGWSTISTEAKTSANIWTSMSGPPVTRKLETFQLLLLPVINVTVLESRQSLVIVLGTAGHLLVCKWNRLEGLQGAWIPPPDSTATGCLEICSVHYKGLFWFPAKRKNKYKHTVSLSPHTRYS